MHRYDVSQVLDWVPTLTRIWNDGKPTRPFTNDEHKFIRNEQILSKLDWQYWSERYCNIMLGGINQSGIGQLQPWESQKMVMRLIAKLEEKSWDAYERNYPVDGILIGFHKARQLGATMISRSIIMHRLTLWNNTQGFSASVDDDKIAELYDRDKRIYESLPFYLQPSLDPRDGSIDQQSMLLKFGKLDTSILYQTSQQKSGLGQGRKFDVSHITEAASFKDKFFEIQHNFFPTIPQTPHSFCVLESTGQGRGNSWHVWTEAVRLGQMARWSYLFVPVYVERLHRYRRQPPADWKPSDITLKQARKIEDTSHEYLGYKVVPNPDFLYWWETTRDEYAMDGSLALFYTNYPSTVEESFQFVTQAAFSPELLQELESDIMEPVLYEFEPSAS